MLRKFDPNLAPSACEFCSNRSCWVDVSRPAPNSCDNCGHRTAQHRRVCEADGCHEIAVVNEGSGWNWKAGHFCDHHKPANFYPDRSKLSPDDDGIITARRLN